ncbi:hypothetical protein FHS95_000136 [Sphingomonas naasensis]|uniref:hypothetical protein n=1 Tax=Sphingomonas naasensis TaxID=1344951 RepID=UPI00141AA19C|nr:hypothetical protein [Sphingomonas naasensis]NIJ18467.1 hypothetical protein [Sphingomonas naasensis]
MPDPAPIPERQAAKQPSTDPTLRMVDKDRRRRGYAAAMFAPNAGAATTTNVTGV